MMAVFTSSSLRLLYPDPAQTTSTLDAALLLFYSHKSRKNNCMNLAKLRDWLSSTLSANVAAVPNEMLGQASLINLSFAQVCGVGV
jgi:hypothetical protein